MRYFIRIYKQIYSYFCCCSCYTHIHIQYLNIISKIFICPTNQTTADRTLLLSQSIHILFIVFTLIYIQQFSKLPQINSSRAVNE